MLRTLRIRNFALIHELEIEFGSGLNVMTGETGAGKSIVLGALQLVLGARASTHSVRDGARRADVEALFNIENPSPELAAALREFDIEPDDDELVVSRVVSREGRSKAYVDGRLVPLTVLDRLGAHLVDLHGQHEHQSLLKPDRQLLILDAYAGLDRHRESLADRVRALRERQREIDALENVDREQMRRLDFLNHEAAEIDRAQLEPDEEDQLRERRTYLANLERIGAQVNVARAHLSDDEAGAAVDRLGQALAALDEIAEYHPDLDDAVHRLQNAMDEIQSVATDILPLAEAEDFDVAELDRINERLSALTDLKRKYGDTIDEILAYRLSIAAEIDALANRDKRLAELRREYDTERDACRDAAAKLTAERKRAATKLAKNVSDSLQELGMEGAAFSIKIDAADLGLRGADRLEFQLAANTGSAARSLRAVASGGELSRLMLALKSVFATADHVPTLIFDEVDAGIGGKVATHVAVRLRALARSHQILCITHLAQIAAAADTHYHVAKARKAKTTVTEVIPVEAESRIEELARLLDGAVTDLSRDHAQDLLKNLAG